MRAWLPFVVVPFVTVLAGVAWAEHPSPMLSPGWRFSEQTGEAIYLNVCQGCHMPQGQGAVGAGRYPALARNDNLRSSGYPVSVVLNGQGAMPPFRRLLSDEQISAVVNYVRTHFGNSYTDQVSAADVKNVR